MYICRMDPPCSLMEARGGIWLFCHSLLYYSFQTRFLTEPGARLATNPNHPVFATHISRVTSASNFLM